LTVKITPGRILTAPGIDTIVYPSDRSAPRVRVAAP
jgi:hypothetical protein